MENEMMVGQTVKSIAGRDKNEYFLVIKILPEEKLVLLVDGEKRKIENPKKKNLRHIQVTRHVAKDLAEQMMTGSESGNREIKRYLKELNVD
ncbi:KOW domain-containing RNA-binding protein [Dehalobacterium formicoaceticum]|uniref:KOW domain-containing RNA-binding protein n=1 Tax=Dehalobacterium formicoaceticum TaxID=51515 RepID=UPI0031F674A1